MHLTKNLKIGCGFNVVPMWHPLRLAEDYAMADILTGGRVIFGVGRGYHTREVETFGAPLTDQAANRETVRGGRRGPVQGLQGKPFSHQGKYYTIPPEVPYRGYTLKDITLVPAPGAAAGGMLAADPKRLRARLRLHGETRHQRRDRRRFRRGGAVERHMIGFQAAYARRGVEFELGERLSLGYQFFIAPEPRAGDARGRPHYEENMKMFGELRLVRALPTSKSRRCATPAGGKVKLPTIEDAVKAGGFLAGRPEDIIEQLKAVEKRYPGLDRVICATPLGTPLEVQLEDLDRFAKEVIPAFRDTRTAAAAQ